VCEERISGSKLRLFDDDDLLDAVCHPYLVRDMYGKPSIPVAFRSLTSFVKLVCRQLPKNLTNVIQQKGYLLLNNSFDIDLTRQETYADAARVRACDPELIRCCQEYPGDFARRAFGDLISAVFPTRFGDHCPLPTPLVPLAPYEFSLFSSIQIAMGSVGDFSKPYRMMPRTKDLRMGLSTVLRSLAAPHR
jgi:hypothetical protein